MFITETLRRAQQLQKRLVDISARLTRNAFSERFNGVDEITPEESFEKSLQDVKEDIKTLREYREMIASANSNTKLSNGMSLIGAIVYLGYLKTLSNSLSGILQEPKESFTNTSYGSDIIRIKTKTVDNSYLTTELEDINNEITRISSEIDRLNIETEV